MSKSYNSIEHPGEKTPAENEKVPPPEPIPGPVPGTSPYLEESAQGTQISIQATRPQIICKICGKVFNSETELEMHMETQHEQRKQPEGTKTRKKSEAAKRKTTKKKR